MYALILVGVGHGHHIVEAGAANFGVFPIPTSQSPIPRDRRGSLVYPDIGQWCERCGTPDDHRVCRGGPPCGDQARYVGGPCTRRHDPHSQECIEPQEFDRTGYQRMGHHIDLIGRLNGNLKIRSASFF